MGDNLRSIVTYEADRFEIVYLRDDVEEQYTDVEIDDAIDESRMASLATSRSMRINSPRITAS